MALRLRSRSRAQLQTPRLRRSSDGKAEGGSSSLLRLHPRSEFTATGRRRDDPEARKITTKIGKPLTRATDQPCQHAHAALVSTGLGSNARRVERLMVRPCWRAHEAITESGDDFEALVSDPKLCKVTSRLLWRGTVLKWPTLRFLP
jgi:hypothetical protein